MDNLNIYIWDQLEHITSYFHHEAGVVIIAENYDTAIRMLKDTIIKDEPYYNKYDNREEAELARIKDIEDREFEFPDYQYYVSATKSMVLIFPNVGCC